MEFSVHASPKIIAIVEREGAEWYAKQVIAPMLSYDFQGAVDVNERIQQHMNDFPEPLRSQCREAVAALPLPSSDLPKET